MAFETLPGRTKRKSLGSALLHDPTFPLVRFLLAKFEENPQRTAFLRDFDLKRLMWLDEVKARLDAK